MVERSPRLSTRRMASHIGGISRMLVLRALHEEDKPCDVTAQHSIVMYSTSNPMYNYEYYTRARNFAVQINGFISLTSYFDVKYRC